MANTLDSTIQQIVTRAASEIAQAVRANIAAEVSKVVALQAPAKAAAAAPAPVKRKPGRPAKAAAPAAAPAPAAKSAAKPAKAAKPAAGKKRRGVSQDELETVLAFIAKNPNKRSEEIRKSLGIDQEQNSKILAKLRELKKVKTKGEKRATTYSV